MTKRIAVWCTILLVFVLSFSLLAVSQVSGQTSGGSGTTRSTTSGSGTSTLDSTMSNISSQMSGDLSGARFVRDNADSTKFVGIDPNAAFVGMVEAGGSTTRRATSAGVTRTTAATSRTTSRSSVNTATSNRGSSSYSGYGTLNNAPSTMSFSAADEYERPTAGTGAAVSTLPSATMERVQFRVDRLGSIKNNSFVQVRLDGNQVVLNGIVPSLRDRQLFEQIVRLEPGVHFVKNNLTVVVMEPAAQP